MKLVFIGDVFGSPGRKVLKALLPEVRRETRPDLIVANCENVAGGAGVTRRLYYELLDMGIDVLTSGNHIWKRREVKSLLEESDCKLIRPLNYPEGTPGKGYISVTAGNGMRIGVINLIGRVNLLSLDCPFRAADRALEQLRDKVIFSMADFHAETSSEKVALGWYLDGRIGALLGTHTHVPTADARILPQGTAYITDVGMTGAMDSVIGIEKNSAIRRFLSGMPVKFKMASENPGMDMVVLEFDHQGKAQSIYHNRRYLE